MVLEPGLREREEFIPAPPIRSVRIPVTRINNVVMKSSLDVNNEYCVLLMSSSFFNVDFMAPVIPELQLEPNPINDTNKIEVSFQDKGTAD